MEIDTLRKLDSSLGPVLCKFLLFLRSVSQTIIPQDTALITKEPENILVMKFFGMGSILLASPSLRELKKKYKSAKITVFTLLSNRELCDILDSIDDVICLDINGPLSFLKSFRRAIFDIRKRRFAIIINLEFLTNFSILVTLLVTFLKKPSIKVGFSSPYSWRNSVHDINVCFDHSKHIMKIFAKTVSSLTGEFFVPSLEPERALLLAKREAGYREKLVRENSDLAYCSFFVCVNINAGELSLQRRWPKEYFAQIINSLIKRPQIAIFLIGGRQDVEYVSQFKKLLAPSSRVIDVCGKTNLKELIGLFSESSLFIANDGGPLHFAVAIGLPTVSFFGPETPHLYGPLNGEEHHVFYEDLFCSPCLTIYNSKMYYCKNNLCLKSIKPEKVLKVIEDSYLPNK
jgi:ADP-heptose:LPS heptosyltransferase